MIKFTCARYDLPIRFSLYEIAGFRLDSGKRNQCGRDIRVLILDNGQEFPVKDTSHNIEKKLEEERIRLDNQEIRDLKRQLER